MEKAYDASKSPEVKRKRPNVLSRLFLCWVCPVLFSGNKRDVIEDDLIPPPGTKYNSDTLGDKFERYWLEELERAARTKQQPYLYKALWRAFWVSYLPGAVYVVGINIPRTVQPLLFTRLLMYWSSESEMSRMEAGFYVMGIMGLMLMNLMCNHHNSVFVGRFGMKVRVACCSLMYRKLLRMSQGSLQNVAAGKLVNLMSNDVGRFEFSFLFIHYLWFIPIQAAVVLYLMYDIAEWAPMVGLAATLVLILPLQATLTKLTAVVRRETAVRTDKRIKLMSEIINGIQVIKMYAWEIPFQKVVKDSREYEMQSLRKGVFIQGTFGGFMLFTERTSMFLTILTMVLNGTMATATTVYPMQQFFSVLQTNIALILPIAIAHFSEMLVSLERIQEFLLMEEREDLNKMPQLENSSHSNLTFKHTDQSNNKNNKNQSYIVPKRYSKTSEDSVLPNELQLGPRKSLVGPVAVELLGVSASWTKAQEKEQMTLKNISLRFRTGKLCAIIGPVGAGKSSLLQVLLKELSVSCGEVTMNGRVSYACQESWLFPATVRENIIFGLPYDSRKYRQVCEACCLMPDFKQFPYGDLSLVSERGVSLSGGQRARINLARAVYRDAEVYLLDDPLSAVDANVGRQLFEGCINGYLRDRTRILVTHQVHFLKAADYIVILNEGSVENVGTYDELSATGTEFSQLLSNPEDTPDGDGVAKRPSLLRGMSAVSVKSEENGEIQKEQIQAAEERATGNLKWSVVYNYLRSVHCWPIVVFTLGALLFSQATATFTDYWVSYWTNQVDGYIESLPEGEDPDTSLYAQTGSLFTYQYIYIHASLILTLIVMSFVRLFGFTSMTMRASKNVHDLMFKNLIRAVMRFFDTNPSGRVLNRFSKDMGGMDELLPRSTLQSVQMYLLMLSVLVLNALALPWTLIPTAALLVIFLVYLRWYLTSAQAIKRLEGTTKSPVFSMLNSTISGMSTIRSTGSHHRLIKAFDHFQDLHSSAFHTYMGGNAAFAFYLDLLCLFYLASLMMLFLFVDFGGGIAVGNVGLAITQSMGLTMLLQAAARFTADFLGQMTAVERVLEYTELPSEENIMEGPTKPPPNWPSEGNVTFSNVFMSYSAEDPPVLKNVSFDVKNGWKVGVVGRTGAGKSSLIAALFRLTNIEGSIKIDGIDTHGIAKQDLRSKISIIPQEPVLFSATVRYNLDPFDSYSDEDIWRALEQVELKDAIPALDYKVSEGGSNFSVGQRQLVCLARAVLRSNKILIMDEATANVDPQTDALIQKTIRREFDSFTVLTIAHRLVTIMDSDRVLVMDKGEVTEFDHPYLLLQKPNSHLSFMVKETGDSMTKTLYEMAKTKYMADITRTSLRAGSDRDLLQPWTFGRYA